MVQDIAQQTYETLKIFQNHRLGPDLIVHNLQFTALVEQCLRVIIE